MGATSVDNSKDSCVPPVGRISKAVWLISLASLLLTLSSSVVTSIGPVYLYEVVKISKSDLGVLEGTVEFISQILRLFAGVFSDSLFSRKSLMVFGFALSTLTKIAFPFATTFAFFFGTKVIDRMGNGIQAAPRDALIGDCSDKSVRGRSYGLINSMKKFGAAFGAMLAFLLAGYISKEIIGYKTVFAVAIVPAVISVLFLIFFVHPPRRETFRKTEHTGVVDFFQAFVGNLKIMGRPFWVLMAVIACYGVAHFNESFLQIRAFEIGADREVATGVIFVLCLVTGVSAYHFGRLSDKFGKKRMFGAGIGFMIIANLIMMYYPTMLHFYFALAFWGLHWAVTQGLLLSLVVDVSPKHLKGTAFGVYYIIFGASSFLANIIAGNIWDVFGADANFMFSSAFGAFTIVFLFLADRRKVFKMPEELNNEK